MPIQSVGRILRTLDPISQSRAPLFEAIRDYCFLDKAPFHTPGHKQGRGIPAELRELLGEMVFHIFKNLLSIGWIPQGDGFIFERAA